MRLVVHYRMGGEFGEDLYGGLDTTPLHILNLNHGSAITIII